MFNIRLEMSFNAIPCRRTSELITCTHDGREIELTQPNNSLYSYVIITDSNACLAKVADIYYLHKGHN